ncbi:aldehyde dehydrogenase family 3 member B1 isoform X2 [Microcaecilia unicolor]|uniref:Aldehyde dehydrogenase family 3 member B1-like isoform X2 n=1 Tax=Microcaecilia unicolor TaxID=1415580 RepID=A0A6P7Z527_9AMPH|nr:aldehyde dehydrogenase family 3 member B1-like isoform X2 [Microcaecilia unicolor]
MDLSSASPAARWLRALRRTVSGENTSMKPSNSVCEDILKKLRGAFIAGRTKPFKFRIAQLQAIVRMLKNNENLFVEALENDMHRPKFETILLEITTVKNEALYAINNLEKWMQPEYIRKDMTSIFDDCFVHREPMGVVLIIGAWTFPIQLCLIPLIGAIAAGNCILLRLPAISSRASELLQKLLSNYLDSECYQVIGEGLIDLAEILESTFDHIFFTAPTVLIDVRETDPVTQQDILGPVLPVVTVKGLEEAIQFINQRERPLATYVYSDNSQVIAEMMSRTSSGSFCSNDSAVQNLYLGLPCCGAGIGGGLYGGKYGFDTFSQSRAYVLRHSVTECVTRFRYPPYLDTNLNLMLWVNYLSHKDGWCQIL